MATTGKADDKLSLARFSSGTSAAFVSAIFYTLNRKRATMWESILTLLLGAFLGAIANVLVTREWLQECFTRYRPSASVCTCLGVFGFPLLVLCAMPWATGLLSMPPCVIDRRPLLPDADAATTVALHLSFPSSDASASCACGNRIAWPTGAMELKTHSMFHENDVPKQTPCFAVWICDRSALDDPAAFPEHTARFAQPRPASASWERMSQDSASVKHKCMLHEHLTKAYAHAYEEAKSKRSPARFLDNRAACQQSVSESTVQSSLLCACPPDTQHAHTNNANAIKADHFIAFCPLSPRPTHPLLQIFLLSITGAVVAITLHCFSNRDALLDITSWKVLLPAAVCIFLVAFFVCFSIPVGNQ